MALLDSFGRQINQVLFEGNSCMKKVILNRPRKLNSISFEMGNGKAFCSGGDIKAYYKHTTEGHWTFGGLFYKKELILCHLLATYKKPLVALIDGIVMGAGAGLSIYTPYRIVTEKTVFAMPEAAIGYFPDVGASHFLSRLPGYFGEYLELTGDKLDGAGMIACGLATHFVLSKDLHMLENALESLTSSDTTAISQLISKFVHQTNMKQDNTYYNRMAAIIYVVFLHKVPLFQEEEAENGEQKWIVDVINSMKSASPASLKIFLRAAREGRNLSLEQCLVREYSIASQIIQGTVNNDYYQGVRAKVLEKGKKPQWQPSKLKLVSKEMVDNFFRNVDDDDWEPLQLPPRSNSLTNHAAKSKL